MSPIPLPALRRAAPHAPLVHSRTIAAVALASVVPALASLIAATPAHASPPAATPGPRYAALGDSYSSGEGNAAFEPKTGDQPGGNGCHRSTWAAWPRFLATKHPAADVGGKVKLIACSGATTRALTSFKGEPAQLTRLKRMPLPPTIVTLTMGGNDMKFADVLTKCYVPLVYGPQACGDEISSMSDRIQHQLPEVLDKAYGAVARALPTSTRVIVVGYPNVVNPKYWNSHVHCPWLTAPAVRMATVAEQLDSVIRAAAERNEFEYVSTLNTLSGHELCTGDAWVLSLKTKLLSERQRQMRGHPKPEGQQAMASAVAEYLERHPASFQGQNPAPNQAMTAGSQQHFFTARRGGGLIHRFWDPHGGITGDVWAGPRVAGTPVAYTHGNQQHVFARSTNGRLIHWVWYPGISTGKKPKLSIWAERGEATSDPTGFSTASDVHVFYRGRNGTLEHRWSNTKIRPRSHDNWSGRHGDRIVGAPAAYTHGYQQHVFARTASGRMLHWVWYPRINKHNKPTWSIWAGRGQARSDPTGFSTLTEQHVFYRGRNGTLEHRWYNNRVKKHFQDNWGGKHLTGTPIAYTLAFQQHVFARTTRGSLVHFVWYPGVSTGDKPSQDTWVRGRVKSDPAGFSTRVDAHVFYRGPKNRLVHWWWSSKTGRFSHDTWGSLVR